MSYLSSQKLHLANLIIKGQEKMLMHMQNNNNELKKKLKMYIIKKF